MTAQSAALGAASVQPGQSRPFLGVGTVVRKELTEWLRGPKALIILGVSVLGAVFMTLIPFIAEATKDAEAAGLLSHDPTANVLIGWTGQTVALIAVLATMALLSTERDRGTLAWSLTNPVSPSSIIAAKYVVATVIFAITAVVLPMILSVALATIVYGGLPDLRVIGTFVGLFLALPAFYIALTVALGTAVKSTVGVAGIAFAVMFLPATIGGLIPVVAELSPTNIGSWAMLVAKGQPASLLTPIGWLVSMVVLVVGAKLVFDRQEL
jgi:ABC-type transport system involved in multi-copper enzyme maturation permease subunit